MMVIGETMTKMQKDIVDRISDLPDFILHDILLILGTKEVGRASILSKRWYEAWSSIPVLDFRPEYFDIGFKVEVEDDKLQRYVEFIDNTMQRYLLKKYRIRKMYLEVFVNDEKGKNLVDLWIRIAVLNQIQEFEIDLHGNVMYEAPEILFCARLLNVLTCRGIALLYYETMELVSLKHLTLDQGYLDEDMLQRIVSLCPLVELNITYDDIDQPISLPWTTTVDGTMQSNLQACPLEKFCFSYIGLNLPWPWPWKMNLAALKNLRKLEFSYGNITDDAVYVLTRGLTALESLVLDSCYMLECVKISSISLKELSIKDCPDGFELDFAHFESPKLVKVTVDSPNLLNFMYNGKSETSLSLIRVADQCNAEFRPFMMYSVADWFELKQFLKEAKLFNSLMMNFSNSDHIVAVRDGLRNIVTDLPYKVRVLNLNGGVGIPTKSSLVAFLDVIFWCCHPDVLSITTYLPDSAAAESILSILKEKEQCRQDPLKNVEVKFINRVYRRSSQFKTMLMLSW